jgi:formiminotetrahydrofolate cyclodeaminase
LLAALSPQARPTHPPTQLGVEALDAYLERLASSDPVPGGGSAAIVVAAIGAALVAMVGRIAGLPTVGIVAEADRLRAELVKARRRDEAAYAAVVAAQAMPKGSDAEKTARREALQVALHRAAEEPLRAAALCLEVLKLTLQLSEHDTRALASDIGCAAEFAAAALAGCAYNVRINHRYMRDVSLVQKQAAMLAAYETEADEILGLVRERIRNGLKA